MAKWTKREEDFLKESYGKISSTEIAEKLDKNVAAVKKKMQRIGLNGLRTRWTDEEIEFLKKNYRGAVTPEILSILGEHGNHSIRIQASKLGLTKGKND